MLIDLVPAAWRTPDVVDAIEAGGMQLEACVAESTVRRDWTFRALSYFAPKDTRVVILGQDPYHTVGKPCGLSFGISKEYAGRRDYSSMGNVVAELEACDYQVPRNDMFVPIDIHRDWCTLEGWAQQGVLLLNTRLSTRIDKPMSHAGMGWEPVVDAVLRQVAIIPGVVWVGWGAEARKVIEALDPDGVCIFTSHPTKYSANRSSARTPAFLGSRWPQLVNDMVEQFGRDPIEWGAMP